MKTLKEHIEGQEDDFALLEEQILVEMLNEGRVGWVAKGAIAALRAKQAGFHTRITKEKDPLKKLDLIAEQVASQSSMFIVLLGVLNKDPKSARGGR